MAVTEDAPEKDGDGETVTNEVAAEEKPEVVSDPGCTQCMRLRAEKERLGEDPVVVARKKAFEAGKPFSPLRRSHRLLLKPAVHDAIWAVTYWTGIRDRLRCPQCRAVGTWKVHGGFFNMVVDYAQAKKDAPKWPARLVRRWLCKNCGYYIGPEGITPDCFPKDVWRLPEDIAAAGWTEEETRTPRKILQDVKLSPWFG